MNRGKDWDVQRKKCFKRDNNTCRKCGEMVSKLDCHHLIPYKISKHNKLWNLITLCQKCHPKMENEYRRIGITHFLLKIINENFKMDGKKNA